MHGGGGGAGGGFGGMGANEPKDPWEELVASNPEPRNWRANIISLMVIMLVLALVTLSVVWITPEDPGPRVRGEKIPLDHIINGKFKPNPQNASWIKGSVLYLMNEYGALCKMDARDGKMVEVLDNTTFRTFHWQRWEISEDEKNLLIVHDTITVFRYSTLALYTIVSLEDRHFPMIKLGVTANGDQDYLQHAQFIPGGGIVFVKDNDIYYKSGVKSSLVTALTTTGERGNIYNGVADWLYEEEILAQSSAIWPAGDGSRLAYLVFNDSLVEMVTLENFGLDRTSAVETNYQENKKLRYPKAGSPNPTVSLKVHHFTKQRGPVAMEVLPPREVETLRFGYYVVSVGWAGPDTLSVLYQNRAQNISFQSLCRHTSQAYTCQVFHREQSPGGWVENHGVALLSSDQREMVLVEPVSQGEAGEFLQVVEGKVSFTDKIATRSITAGQSEVTAISGWDERNNIIYYMATLPDSPGVRHLFRVSPGNQSVCLTCPGHQAPGLCSPPQDCQYSRVSVSPDQSAYLQHCLGPHIPTSHLFSLPDNKCVATLDTNQHLRSQVSVSSMPWKKYLSVKLPGSRTPARVKLLLPPVLREHEEFSFPLVVNIYGGPGTQTVDTTWSVGWDTYLASQRNFIIANIDVSGSGYQGEDHKESVYGQLGELETRDLLHVITHLRDSLHYVDRTRICVWGWSYGGYLTGLLLSRDTEDLLACGVSVSPVTDWRQYDTAYTERLMGRPDQFHNWQGYTTSSLVRAAPHIPSGKFLLIHGTEDDNVHVSHSWALSSALVESDVLFRQQIYPDQAHSLAGVQRHLYQTMEQFLDQIFGPIEDYFLNDYYQAAALLLQQYREELS